MPKNKKKILFLPVGIGLAHTGRLVVLAKELKGRGYDVFFGAGNQAPEILKQEKLPYKTLPELPRTTLQKIRKLSANVFSVKEMEKFVRAELELYQDVQPDLVVADGRPTAKISTKVAGIPFITVNNAVVTKFYDFSKAKFPLPILFLSQFLPPRMLSPLEKKWLHSLLDKTGVRLVEALLIKELIKFNLVLRKLGVKSPIRSVYNLLLGDLSLLCDAPFYRPIKKLPQNVKMVGPLFWQPEVPLPSWAAKVTQAAKNGQKIVYVTAAGTGDKKVFQTTLNFLSALPIMVVATTGNTISPQKISRRGNIFLTDFLPGDWIMSKAEAVVFFGGNSTAYQALYFGVPQVVIPLHIDQEDNANQLVRLGTGVVVSPYRMEKNELLVKVLQVLNEEKYRKATERYQKRMLNWDGPKNAAREIEKFLKQDRHKEKETGLLRLLPQIFNNGRLRQLIPSYQKRHGNKG